MSLKIAIVGRPNVGKSTLFNRLIGKKLALVDDQPGVTRDLRNAEVKAENLNITLIDTAGLEEAPEDTLQYKMSTLSLAAIKECDLCLFVIDARTGLTAADEAYASKVRRISKLTLLVANKVEGRTTKSGIYEAFSLGLGEPIPVSAEHGIGIKDLKQKFLEIFELSQSVITKIDEKISSSLENLDVLVKPNKSIENNYLNEKEIQISIIGRPNSGKSTLVNKIVGNQRLLTGPEAGITRDAISSSINWLGKKVCIFDTAGVRKKTKIQSKLEKLSVSDGLRAVRFSEIIILLLDVRSPFESQDLKIADLAEREGRCVVIAINKWDLEAKKNKKIVELRKSLSAFLPQLSGVALVPISALSGLGLSQLHKEVLRAYDVWNIRILTSKLNDWLIIKINSHPPPTKAGKQIRMRYITQVNNRPPSFVIFTSFPKSVPESYKRYLINGLRQDFGLLGVPIRLMLRAGKNPYKNKSKK